MTEEEKNDPVLGQWPELVSKTDEALERGDTATWRDALGKCQNFRLGTKEQLDRGDRLAQAFNREKVVEYGLPL